MTILVLCEGALRALPRLAMPLLLGLGGDLDTDLDVPGELEGVQLKVFQTEASPAEAGLNPGSGGRACPLPRTAS